jgi:acetoacetyl-CoA synthetase
MSEPIWQPSPQRIEQANMTAFARTVARSHGKELLDYGKLRAWSVDDRAAFWQALWDFAGIKASRGPDRVLVDGDRMPGARWFVGAELNFAENLLRYRDDRLAIVALTEDGKRHALTHAELHDEVAMLAAALKAEGVGPGDRVAAVMPHIPETLIAMLATTSLGAIWSSCSPDFGARGVLDRFGQIEPKVLIAVDGYRYNGKPIDLRDKLLEIARGLPTPKRIVLVPFLNPGAATGGLPNAVRYHDYADPAARTIEFAQLPFDHPVYILYSSGTTGIPKAIVHGAGGTLLQHIKELKLHSDVKREDRLFYFTTCGWMMWNWQATALALGATLLLYDGSPFHPDGRRLFELAERERVTIFGTSAKYIDAVKKADLEPGRTHDLSALKAMLSTGSPLAPESFDFVYRRIKRDLHLASISGGTDIVSCFVLGNPIGPVWRGEIQTRGLGMAVEVWDDDGRPVLRQPGEMVCTRPFPSMPVGFWNDPDGSRYQAAYFARFPGVWTHGDLIELTGHGGIVIYGRSDATLNPGGVRIGTAEIYRQVEQIPEVLEALAVGQQWDGDVRVVLFVRLAKGTGLDDALGAEIRRRIRNSCTPRHVPARIIAIADIPRTMNGKIAELAVREAIHGRPVKNVEALANPGSLELYRDLPELRS